MTITQEQATWFAQTFGQIADNVERAVLGKRHVVELVLTAMLSDGHVLLEDVPGTGKTSLARAMAQSVQGTNTRIQFTPDLLPGRHHRHHASTTRRPASFEFHAGPIFANIVLADEINRASPKTQSALLEVMEEGKVTIDGVSRQVGVPFLVLATQNPVEQAGTYRLPEAQLDRFMMRASLGYPDHAATVRILDGAAVADGRARAGHHAAGAGRHGRPRARPSTSTRSSSTTSRGSSTAPRSADEVRLGVSIRGALALTKASRTRAASQGRTYVTPDDVKALAVSVLSHRLILHPEAEFDGVTPGGRHRPGAAGCRAAQSPRGRMSLTESRLTRTSASTGPDGVRAHGPTATTSDAGHPARAAAASCAPWCGGRGVSRASARRSRPRPSGARARCGPPGVLVAARGDGRDSRIGIAFGWVEWMVAGAVALAPAGRCACPFLFGARSYDVDLVLAHERVVAGDGVTGEIVVRNDGRRIALPGRLDIPVGAGLVEFGVPLLRPGHTVAQPLEIPALRRGIVTVGPATTVRSDPIGLLRREHAFDDVHELYVHPRTTSIPSTSAGLIRDLEGNPTRRLVDADMSFHAIREYAPGDSRRQIHWKSTAKTGQLMVRQYEESRRSRMAVVLVGRRGRVRRRRRVRARRQLRGLARAARRARRARASTSSPGREIPRVVRGRLRAIRHIPAASPRARCSTASARVDLLENTMPIAEVCRLAAEAERAPVDRVRRRRLAGAARRACGRRRSASPPTRRSSR